MLWQTNTNLKIAIANNSTPVNINFSKEVRTSVKFSRKCCMASLEEKEKAQLFNVKKIQPFFYAYIMLIKSLNLQISRKVFKSFFGSSDH